MDNSREWTVFPLMHTFPAYDPDKTKWVESTCAHCPKTVALIKKLPHVRTALFSRLGPGTKVQYSNLLHIVTYNISKTNQASSYSLISVVFCCYMNSCQATQAGLTLLTTFCAATSAWISHEMAHVVCWWMAR